MKIYYAKADGLTEEEMHAAMQLLPKARTDKIENSKQKKSRMQSVAAGMILEYALQKKGLHGKSLTFLANGDGKPYIKEYPNLYYNLSHSGDYVALVVDGYPVGVDIERLRTGGQKLVKRFFSEEEVLSLEHDWRDEEFTRLWTRKESYLKATGFGMRMPLEGFSTLAKQVQVNEKMCAEMVNPKDIYYLESFQIEEDYWLSVCRKEVPILTGQTCIFPKEVDLKEILSKV